MGLKSGLGSESGFMSLGVVATGLSAGYSIGKGTSVFHEVGRGSEVGVLKDWARLVGDPINLWTPIPRAELTMTCLLACWLLP